jgi:hypothetical protein
MKILFLVQSFYPNKDGVQFVTNYQIENLINSGHTVTVFTSAKNNQVKYELYNNIRIFRFNIFDKFTFHFGQKNNYIQSVIKESKLSDLMVAVCLQSGVTDLILKHLNKIKVPKVLYMHGMHDFRYNESNFESILELIKKIFRDIRWRLFYFLNKKFIRMFHKIIHLHIKDYSYRFFVSRNIKNNYIIENSSKINSNLTSKEHTIISFLNVANFSTRKNQIFLLKAFSTLNLPNTKLILCGNSPNRYYKRLINFKSKLDKKHNIEICVGLNRTEIDLRYSAASVFLLSSTWEAFPVVIVESMLSKMPFISRNVGIVPFIPGGFIANSISSFVYYMSLFAKNPQVLESYSEIAHNYANLNFNLNLKTRLFENLLIDCYETGKVSKYD